MTGGYDAYPVRRFKIIDTDYERKSSVVRIHPEKINFVVLLGKSECPD